MVNLGHLHLKQGVSHAEAAKTYYLQALTQSYDIEAMPVILECLVGFAGLQVQAQQFDKAAIRLGLALNHPSANPNVHSLRGDAQGYLTCMR